MEFKGTKGKWKIDLEYKSIERAQIIDSNNNGFIDVWKLGEITKKEMKANALLISKAPEMLKALLITIEELEDIDVLQNHRDYLITLIKEATEL